MRTGDEKRHILGLGLDREAVGKVEEAAYPPGLADAVEFGGDFRQADGCPVRRGQPISFKPQRGRGTIQVLSRYTQDLVPECPAAAVTAPPTK